MKILNNNSILIWFFLVLIFLGCEKEKPEKYVLTEKDGMEYLLDNSDLVAVVNISGGSRLGESDPLLDSVNEVEAEVTRIILNEGSSLELGNLINIYSSTYRNDKNDGYSFIVIRNGMGLVFLKELPDGCYSPLTNFSISNFIAGNNVLPIWKNDEVSGFSKGFDIEVIVGEMEQYLKQRKAKGSDLDMGQKR